MDNYNQGPVLDEARRDAVLSELGILFWKTLQCAERVRVLNDIVPYAQELSRDQQLAQHTRTISAMIDALKQRLNFQTFDWEVLREMPIPFGSSHVQLGGTMRVAAVVLAHGHFDSLLNQLLALCVRNQPALWLDRVSHVLGKAFDLSALFTTQPDAALAKSSEHYLKTLQHKSIAKRNNLLLSTTRLLVRNPLVNHWPDDDIKAFDALRNGFPCLSHDVDCFGGEGAAPVGWGGRVCPAGMTFGVSTGISKARLCFCFCLLSPDLLASE